MSPFSHLFVNDQKVAEGWMPQTGPFIFSADETADVGMDDDPADPTIRVVNIHDA